ncbi:hypothetical protein B4N84_15165, partial [Flavobacterium sp. IR1]
DRFKEGAFRYLVATGVAGRGIDVADINLVINFDVPTEKENYVHRIGRTGRAGKKGKAVTLVTPSEYGYIDDIEDFISEQITRVPRPIKEEVRKAVKAFQNKLEKRPQLKENKAKNLNQDIMKLYLLNVMCSTSAKNFLILPSLLMESLPSFTSTFKPP